MSSSSPVLWYAGQATGMVSLALFSAVTVLGVMVQVRTTVPGLPRFGTVTLHRTLSMLAMVFLAIHIVTAVADSYVDISLVDSVVPFVGDFQPLWLGLGTVGFDLLLAVIVTSMLRARTGHRVWRAVHWLAYASWPVAVVHGLTLGSGTGGMASGVALWLTAACVVAVPAAVAVRITAALRPAAPRTPAELLARSTTVGARPPSPRHREYAATGVGTGAGAHRKGA
ncbi:ferric reductase-like transmembrane domain-containing protein [Streptacidiphilus carbonis]|uniref:ferric reductase-like transmembrane domain-containing protein n=1 Tax=Streptacidiphilus carbonis TaxID=105422 RepID=UPI0007C6EB85|nr:ferric reductase-like transmembrane domain-containing protein [Streptacidiphilus carbonis]